MASYRYRAQRPDRPHTIDYYDPNGRRRSRTFVTEKQALTFARGIETKIERGEYIDPAAGRTTLGELADEFMAGLSGLRAATEATNRSLLESRIRPTFGSRPIAGITTADIRAWVRGMEKEGLSPSRIKKGYMLLRQILQTAVADTPRRLLANPAYGIKTPPVIAPEHLYLDAAQLAQLELALEEREQGAGLIAIMAGWEGLRWGELRSTRRSWVDLGRRKLTVAESNFQRGAKNKRVDTIALLPPALGPLTERLAGMPIDGRALLHTRPNGDPLHYAMFRKTLWDPAVTDAGLPDDLTPHALRHTCASLLIAQGWHPKRVQQHLRHSSIRVTMDLYGHLYPDDEEALHGPIDATYTAARDAARARRAAGDNVVELR